MIREQLDPSFVPGWHYLVLGAVIVFVLGVAEIIASGLIVSDSGFFYYGGWYAGILCMICGIYGCLTKTAVGVTWLAAISCGSFIAAVVAAAVLSVYLNFLDELNACASYDSSDSNDSCNYKSYYECYGDSDYYADAVLCEADYLNDNDFDDTSDQCTCVRDGDDNDCYDFHNVKDCGKFFGDLPRDVNAAYIIAILSAIAAVLLTLLSCVSLKLPRWLASDDEIRAHTLMMTTALLPSESIQPTVTAAEVSESVSRDHELPQAIKVQNSNSNPIHSM